MISFKLVSEGIVRILMDSLKAENGAKHRGPSATIINSSPAMGPIIASCNGYKESTVHFVCAGSLSLPLLDRESSVGSSDGFSQLTPTQTTISLESSCAPLASTSVPRRNLNLLSFPIIQKLIMWR